MAIAQAQYVDLLVKQLYGVAKTDTSTNKSPSNESIPSPALIRGDTQWTQSDQIPATAAALSGIVQAYTGVNAIQCAPDTTTVPIGGVYPTWLTNLTDWIPQEFGSTYVVQAWVDSPGVANPTLTGTQIFAAGTGGTGEYYFDNIAGLLNFIGGTIPSALTSSKVIYIVGYRYIGLVGVTHLPSNTDIGNLNFTGTTVSSTDTNGNIILTPDGTGIVLISSSLTSNGNITADYFLGNGSLLTGIASSNTANEANTANFAGTVTSSSQPNITSVGTLISLDVSGNISVGNANLGNLATANYFSGSGNLLSNIQGSNITGNVTSAITSNFANYAGNVTVSSQPNITSVGTLTSLDISGNLTSGNANLGNLVTANYFSGSGNNLSNIQGSNVTGNVTSAITANFANYAGNVTVAAQPNITSVGTLTSLDITGELTAGNANLGNAVTANYYLGNGSLLTGITSSNVANNANNANFAGTVTTNAQPNITSVGTLTSLDVSGNLAVGNANLGNLAIANYFSGSGNLLSNIQGSNVTGNVTSALTANFANFAGNITVASQPNITSVGTLTSLDISGNLSASNANLGNLVTANYFSGSGNNLSNIQGSNITGNVTSAITSNFANYAGNVTVSDQPNITSVGTLISLDITGDLTSGNANLGNLVIANYFSGSGNNLSNIQGSNVTGNVTSAITANFANFAGNITVASQPNITSVGTLTSLDISGNLSANNANLGNLVTANYFSGAGNNLSNIQGSNVTGNVTSAITANFANYAGNVTVSDQPNITSVGTLTSLDVSGNANTGNLGTNNFIATGTGSFSGNVNMNTSWINNVGYPSVSTDAASKSYVDTMISSGIAYHQPVLVATTTTLAIATGGTTAYVQPNGAGNGVGAYISTTGTYSNIDGTNVQTIGTRILVKNESNAAWNGVYTYSNTTAIVRATDADEYGVNSAEQFSVNDFFFTQNGVVNEGTSFIVSEPSGVITFGTSNIQFTIFTTSQVYEAGTGLTLTGTIFSISNTAVTAGTYGNGDRVATFTVNDQGQLTAASDTVITANAANLTGTTLNSTVVNSSLTSVGTLTSLDVSGNSTFSNILGIFANGNSNISIPASNGNINFTSVGNATMVISGTGVNIAGTLNTSGNANVGNIGATAGIFTTVAGSLTTAAQPNITSVGTLTSLDVSGNANVGNIGATEGIFNSVAGSLTTAAQPNITSVGILTSLAISGNLSAGNANLGNLVTANFFSGSGNNLSNIQGSNVTGNVTSAITANFANYAGNVTVAAQPNITSVGTLTSLDISGNLTSGNANLGNLVTANFFSGSGNNLSNIQGSNVTGNVTSAITSNFANFAGNVTVSSQPNITSVGTLTSLDVSGNIVAGVGTGGNITGANLVSANYFSGSGNLLSNIQGSNVTGNVTSAITANFANFAGNVTVSDQPNITSVGTLISLDITGNLSAGNANLGNLVIANYFSGAGNNLSNIQGSNVTGNVTSAITANFANYSGNITVAAQPNITSVGTLTSLDITGNLSAGNANLGNLVTVNYISGVLTTGAQPNITSTGTLSNLNVSGNVDFTGGNVTLGSISNLHIGGGSANYVLQTDGSGNLSWAGISSSGISNGNSNVNIPNANGNVNISAEGNANVFVVTGLGANITGYANVVGNLNTTNIVTGGGSGGSITGANLVSANYISGTLTSNASSQPNVTSIGTLTSLDVSGHMIANTFQMGYGVYAFYSTSVYFATTASTSSNQVLWDYPAADLSAIDFTIIATDSVGATRQSCKISAAILGTSVAYNEYGGLFINGGVGSFSVVYNGSGPTPTLELVVTPDSSNLTEYNMLISKYLV